MEFRTQEEDISNDEAGREGRELVAAARTIFQMGGGLPKSSINAMLQD